MSGFFSGLMAVVSVLRGLLDLWKTLKRYREEQTTREEEAKSRARDKALEDLKRAQTEEEFDAAQSDIVKNSP